MHLAKQHSQSPSAVIANTQQPNSNNQPNSWADSDWNQYGSLPTSRRIDPDWPTGDRNGLIRKKNLTRPNGRRGENETPVARAAVKSDARASALAMQRMGWKRQGDWGQGSPNSHPIKGYMPQQSIVTSWSSERGARPDEDLDTSQQAPWRGRNRGSEWGGQTVASEMTKQWHPQLQSCVKYDNNKAIVQTVGSLVWATTSVIQMRWPDDRLFPVPLIHINLERAASGSSLTPRPRKNQ